MSSSRVVRMVSTPLALIVLLGLLTAGLVWGFKTVTEVVPAPPPTPCATFTMTDLTTSSVTVSVYNGGSQRGLATKVGTALRTGGFIVKTVGNTELRVRSTIIIGASADSPEVQLVAAWFVNPEIQEDGRADHSVEVLVGNEYEGMVEAPPASLTLPTGTVCLPASATPTPTAEPTDGQSTPVEAPTDQPT